MFALDADSGKLVWRSNTSKVPPFGRGGFFSSPAIAFGSVYAARDDGTVYAFDEKTGKVEWHFDTGGAVYGSPAVAAALPSEDREPSGINTTTAITATITATIQLAHHMTRRRAKRSMNTPMNGLINVYGR